MASQLEAVSPHAEARFTTSTAGIDEYLPRSTSLPAPSKVSIARHRTASAFKFLLRPLQFPSTPLAESSIFKTTHNLNLARKHREKSPSMSLAPMPSSTAACIPAAPPLSLSAGTVWCTRPERSWLDAAVSVWRLWVDIRDGKFPAQYSNFTRDRHGEKSKHPPYTRGERGYKAEGPSDGGQQGHGRQCSAHLDLDLLR